MTTLIYSIPYVVIAIITIAFIQVTIATNYEKPIKRYLFDNNAEVIAVPTDEGYDAIVKINGEQRAKIPTDIKHFRKKDAIRAMDMCHFVIEFTEFKNENAKETN